MVEKGRKTRNPPSRHDPFEVSPLPASPSQDHPAPSLRDRLRADTREAHEALDASFAGMFSDPEGAHYRRFIAMNLAAHEAIEPVLAASPLGLMEDGTPETPRLRAARQDARQLGLPDISPGRFPLPAPDLAEAFGIAYVLEGSRLGAKYMSRAIKRDTSGGDTRWPTYYLEASADVRPFTRLLERMAAEPVDEAGIRRAVEAADTTFRFFRMLCGQDEKRTTRA